jgi:putative FmdB family regulatory protein
MPTYEYACTSCNHEWEAEQSIKESPLTDCPHCQKATARRQISRGTGFILKGSGWYSDLYSSSSNKKPEPAGDKASSDKGSSDKGSSGSGEGGTSGTPASGSTPSSTPSSAPSAAAA